MPGGMPGEPAASTSTSIDLSRTWAARGMADALTQLPLIFGRGTAGALAALEAVSASGAILAMGAWLLRQQQATVSDQQQDLNVCLQLCGGLLTLAQQPYVWYTSGNKGCACSARSGGSGR